MSRKHRPLTVTYRVDRAPAGTTNRAIIRALLASIEQGDFKLPDQYRVTLGWQNEGKPFKEKDFTEAMKESTTGFQDRVMYYLEALLAKAQEPPSKSDQLEGLRKEYEQRDQAIRRANEQGRITDTKATIERTQLLRWYREQQRRIRES